MDDFFAEMRPTLEDIKASNLASETHDSRGILQTYFPNMFADALIPANPVRWPAFVAGSSISSQSPELGDKITTPLDNLVVVKELKEYLETSQSDVQWHDRLWQVAEDTVTINAASELGKDPGAFAAGVLANKRAGQYMNEMVETGATLNNQEKINNQFFKQVA